MGWFKPIWMTENDKKSDKARAAVCEMSAQKELERVATKAPLADVREAAVEKLTDQAVLAQIVLNDSDQNIRYSAGMKLTDQSLLEKIAREHENFYIRIDAVKRITDQTVLAQVALNDRDAIVREYTVVLLTDQAVLAQVALNDSAEHVRIAAVKTLTDQAVLTRVAFEDVHWQVRDAATSKLTDKATLTQLADRSDLDVRSAAARQLVYIDPIACAKAEELKENWALLPMLIKNSPIEAADTLLSVFNIGPRGHAERAVKALEELYENASPEMRVHIRSVPRIAGYASSDGDECGNWSDAGLHLEFE